MTKKTWNTPSVEVITVRNAKMQHFAQADHAGTLKGINNQS